MFLTRSSITKYKIYLTIKLRTVESNSVIDTKWEKQKMFSVLSLFIELVYPWIVKGHSDDIFWTQFLYPVICPISYLIPNTTNEYIQLV